MKSIFLLAIFSGLANAADLPWDDKDFGCLDQSDADRYVREFSVDVQSFGGFERCDAAKDAKKLFDDFSLIERAQFQAAPQHKFIRGYVDRGNYYNWFKSQTYGVNRGHDIPWATAYNSGGYFTMQDGWRVLSTLGRVGTIIHEARHTEGYRHYPCTYGPYAGTGLSGCDTSYEQGGSHAIEMEYYARVVLESTNLHPVYKSMARLMALGRSNFVFNTQPMQKREALLGLSGKNLVLADAGKLYVRENSFAEDSSRLKRTSFGANLWTNGKFTTLDLFTPDNLGVSVKDDFSYFKLFEVSRPNQPTSVKDVEELDVSSNRFFTVLDDSGRLSSFDFPSGGWHAASAPLAGAKTLVTQSPDGQTGLFAVTDSGSVVPFDLRNLSWGQPLAQRWTSDISAYAKLNGQAVKLTAQGQVLDMKNGPVEMFKPYRFTDLINVPLYDAFDVR